MKFLRFCWFMVGYSVIILILLLFLLFTGHNVSGMAKDIPPDAATDIDVIDVYNWVPTKIFGKFDINEDGIVNHDDVQVTSDYIMGRGVWNWKMDVNLDDKVNVLDLTLISRAYNPRPTPTPIVKISTAAFVSTYMLSQEEFTRIVSLEADQSYSGALGVATVILNRVENGAWGKTIHQVVSAPGQFTTYRNRTTSKITDITRKACSDAINGKRNLPKNCMYFCTIASYRQRPGRVVYGRYGNHVWYGYK